MILFTFPFLIATAMSAKSYDSQAEDIMESSLRHHRVQACDGELVTLSCPRHTHILIHTGFYGRVVPPSQLCPDRKPFPNNNTHPHVCDVIHAHSKLAELCDRRRKCSIEVRASTFEDDPCPGTSKYLQMSYKCVPVSFEGETFCEGTHMQLACREGRRLAVFSAQFGKFRLQESSAHCSQEIIRDKNFTGECSKDVLPLMFPSCHARPSCSMQISAKTFSSTCPEGMPQYLHIMFMCVNEEVFNEEAIKGEMPGLRKHFKYFEGSGLDSYASAEGFTREESSPTETVEVVEKETKDESQQIHRENEVHKMELEDHNEHKTIAVQEDIEHDMREPGYGPHPVVSVLADQGEMLHNDASSTKQTDNEADEKSVNAESQEANLVGIFHDVLLVGRFIEDNKEKAILCVALSVSLAVILLLVACLLHQLCATQKDKRIRYSVERSALIARSSQVLNGPSHLVDLGDVVGDDSLFHYSNTPNSSHYHF